MKMGGDHDHILVAWDPPRHNGGSKILEFELEARKWKETNYLQGAKVKGSVFKTELKNVNLGESYAVRCRAKNEAGPGPWSLDSEQMVVKPRVLAPKVSFKTSNSEVSVQAGESFKIEVDINAEPSAEDVTFSIGDKLLNNGLEGVKIVIKSSGASLEINPASRKMSGLLTCVATNRHGRGEAQLKLDVK